MDKELLKKLQNKQFEVLSIFARVCEENSLRYFLDGGTLLGAVRHKGFIPWDDDLDVGMPRDDYEKFCEIAKDVLPDSLFWQTYYTDSNYPNAFGKLRVRNTVFEEEIYARSKIRGGIFIDVLPFDNYPDKIMQQICQGIQIEIYKHLLLAKHKVRPWLGMKGMKRAFKKLEYVMFVPFTVFVKHEKVIDYYEKCLKKYNCIDTKFVKEPDLRYGKVVVPNSCVKEFIKLDFETQQFLCPKDYEAFLRKLYGDYMKLPPEDQREGWHNVREIKFEK